MSYAYMCAGPCRAFQSSAPPIGIVIICCAKKVICSQVVAMFRYNVYVYADGVYVCADSSQGHSPIGSTQNLSEVCGAPDKYHLELAPNGSVHYIPSTQLDLDERGHTICS